MSDHDTIQARIHDYVDGELRPAERAAVRAHAAECRECRAEIAFLTQLKERVADLPREIAPRRDLWAGIEARLEPRGADAGTQVIPIERLAAGRAPARWRARALLAVAATVLVAFTSVVTARLVQDRYASGAMAGAPATLPQGVPGAQPEERPLTSLAAFAPMEQEYLGTLEVLEAELALRRERLSPQTVAVVEENLRIIDAAIAEIHAALLADSTNVELPLLLGGAYRSKVELLQSVVQLNSRA